MQLKTAKARKGIISKLLKFSLPLILSGILQQLYNWADAFIVGNTEGDLALAAVGATTAAINFFLNMILGFTSGIAVLAAQKFGNRENDVLPKILGTFTSFLGITFLIISIAGLWSTPAILRALNTTPDIFEMAAGYLRIIFAGFPFLSVYNVYSAVLRGIGDSKAPFYSVLLSSVVNVALDIWFVIFLRWSVTGAAVATVISQVSATIFIVIYGNKKYRILRREKRSGWIDRSALRLGLKFGIPPMIQTSVSSAGGLILQRFMNGFGTHTVTAVTTAYRVDSIVMLPITNLGTGVSTLVGQDTGAGNQQSAKKTLAAGSALTAAVSLLLTAAIIPNGGTLVALFGAGAKSVSIGKAFFTRIASFYIVFGLATAVRSYLEGTGDLAYSSFAGIVSLIFRIILSYALADVFGNMVIAYAEAFSWLLLLVMYLLRLPKHFRSGMQNNLSLLFRNE